MESRRHRTVSAFRQDTTSCRRPLAIPRGSRAHCRLYGLHSSRYARATYNFGRVSDRDLQEQMGHSSFTTTQRYIKYAEQHREKTYDVFLAESLKRKSSWHRFGVFFECWKIVEGELRARTFRNVVSDNDFGTAPLGESNIPRKHRENAVFTTTNVPKAAPLSEERPPLTPIWGWSSIDGRRFPRRLRPTSSRSCSGRTSKGIRVGGDAA